MGSINKHRQSGPGLQGAGTQTLIMQRTTSIILRGRKRHSLIPSMVERYLGVLCVAVHNLTKFGFYELDCRVYAS